MAIVGLVLTIVFGFLSVAFYLRSIRHKQLAFTYELSELLTTTNPEVSIAFRNRTVDDLSKLRVACWNSGTQEIRREDIPGDRPTAVVFTGATVLSVTYVEAQMTLPSRPRRWTIER